MPYWIIFYGADFLWGIQIPKITTNLVGMIQKFENVLPAFTQFKIFISKHWSGSYNSWPKLSDELYLSCVDFFYTHALYSTVQGISFPLMSKSFHTYF